MYAIFDPEGEVIECCYDNEEEAANGLEQMIEDHEYDDAEEFCIAEECEHHCDKMKCTEGCGTK